jgi:CTP synthase (UTP-ammonia lyase)
MAVEFARNAAGIAGAVHGESSPDGEAIVVAPLACSLVGEERTVVPVPGTRLAAICGDAPFTGFHWCGYGLVPGMAERLAAAGLVIGAHADDAGVEAFELPDHPFYVATLFQPQVNAPLHPLIGALLEAATARGARASQPAGTPTARGAGASQPAGTPS